jgi:hypothetical protein
MKILSIQRPRPSIERMPARGEVGRSHLVGPVMAVSHFSFSLRRSLRSELRHAVKWWQGRPASATPIHEQSPLGPKAAMSNRSRLRRHTEASPETSGYCTKATVPFSLPCRLSMNTRMNEGELRDRGRAQHEWVEIRQAHAPIH